MTSNLDVQVQVIHLLNQLIRLRVNYSLLDADQIFIAFVLKQFEFVEAGQIGYVPDTYSTLFWNDQMRQFVISLKLRNRKFFTFRLHHPTPGLCPLSCHFLVFTINWKMLLTPANSSLNFAVVVWSAIGFCLLTCDLRNILFSMKQAIYLYPQRFNQCPTICSPWPVAFNLFQVAQKYFPWKLC